MFRKSKREKDRRGASFLSENGEEVPTTKRHSKLFSFGKKEKRKPSFQGSLEGLESPGGDGIRVDESLQSKHDIHDPTSEIKIEVPQNNLFYLPAVNENKTGETQASTLPRVASVSGSRKLSGSSLNFDFGTDSSLTFQNFAADVLRATEEKLVGVNLKLPEVTPPKPVTDNSSRTIHVKRTPAGDFGIVLRRTSSKKKGDRRVIHLVEPSNENVNVGLLPGDRLVAVDGVNVEDSTREHIIGMIAASANSVTLAVAPVPEFAELTSRTTIGQSHSPKRTPTLARSGSIRQKILKTVKTDTDLELEKAWLGAEKVWLVHAAGYSPGQLYKEKNQNNEVIKNQVKLDHGGEIVNVEEHVVEKVNPPNFDRAENLSTLQYLNESSCLHTLRQRYAANLIHTFAGDSLIIIKPKERSDDLYTNKVMQMFRGCKQEDMPPHIFATAQTVYRNMSATNTPQSIVFWGNAGSGKTYNFCKAINYLSTVVVADTSKATALKLDAALSLIESFRNCRSILSDNTSTGRNLVQLDFDASGLIVGANIQNFVLGKSRFAFMANDESCYHIFYHLLSGCEGQLKSDLMLDSLPRTTNILVNINKEFISSEQYNNTDIWNSLLEQLKILGISKKEIFGILAPLSAILHLGVAGIKKVSEEKSYFADSSSAQRAALLLGKKEVDLANIIFSNSLARVVQKRRSNSSLSRTSSVVSRGTEKSDASNRISSPESVTDLEYELNLSSLDAFCYGLYIESFTALLRLINRSMNSASRVVQKICMFDMPGFQNQMQAGRPADLQSFCVNYCCEKIQWLMHLSTFNKQLDRYSRENIDCNFDMSHITSPSVTLSAFDKMALEKRLSRSNMLEEKGVFWIMEDEALRSNSNEIVLVDKIKSHHPPSKGVIMTDSTLPECFMLMHYQNTCQVKYDTTGWLRRIRDHPNTKMAYRLLVESNKLHIADLYSGHSSGIFQTTSSGHHGGPRRRSHNILAASRKNSMSMQIKLQMDRILDILERTRINFVYCLLPDKDAGALDMMSSFAEQGEREAPQFDVPFTRGQLRSSHLLESMRLHRQGYPGHISYPDFRRRFNIILKNEDQTKGPVLDEKQAVIEMVKKLDLDERGYKLGLSQIFFRAAGLARLEDLRDEKLGLIITQFEARCRGYLARKRLQKLKLQQKALQCIQRNVRLYSTVSRWPWWRLFTKVLPLLDVHRTETQLQTKSSELATLNTKLETLQQENEEHLNNVTRLKKKIQELSVELAETQTSASNSNDLLDQEALERNRLEDELQDIRMENESLLVQRDQLERESKEAQSNGHSIMFVEASDDQDRINENDDKWLNKYQQYMKEQENVKRKLVDDHEKEIEELMFQKRNIEKTLSSEREETDEVRRQLANSKRKLGKTKNEMEDMRLLLQSGQGRNSELEKKQRKFDHDMGDLQEELDSQVQANETLQREKERAVAEKLNILTSLAERDDEINQLKRKVKFLSEEIEEYSSNTGNSSNEVLQLKRVQRENEVKIEELEEELDEQAGKIQQLEQIKLKLEMAGQRDKQQYDRDIEAKDDEISQIRADHAKKLQLLEEQLDDENRAKYDLQKAKREMERRIFELQSNSDDVDRNLERKMKKELKKLRILYKDAKTALENQDTKTQDTPEIKNLRNQLEDSDFTKHMAIKAKTQLQADVEELTIQLDDANHAKLALEERCLGMTRENTDLQTRMDEVSDEMDEMIRTNRNLLQQISDDQKSMMEVREKLRWVEEERDQLTQTVEALTQKLDATKLTKVDKLEVDKVQLKLREAENKLELEVVTRIKCEHQTQRFKAQVERLQDDRDQNQAVQNRNQQNNAKLERQMKEMRSEMESVKRQEAELKRRREETENQLQLSQDELSRKKAELTSSEKRIRDLQESIDGYNSSEDDTLLEDESDDGFLPSRRPSLSRRLSSRLSNSLDHNDSFSRRSSLRRISSRQYSHTTSSTYSSRNITRQNSND